MLGLLLVLLSSLSAHAVTIPTGLSETDRAEVARMLGIATSSKLLSNPYPMGGYSGFEVGVSFEFLDTENLTRLGNGTEVQDDLVLPRLAIGKGLYSNVDLNIHFSPAGAGTGANTYGGLVRYTFYEAQFIPMTLSFLTHASVFSVNDVFSSLNVGGDLMVGVNTNSLAVYFGFGQIQNKSQFLASGSRAVTTAGVGTDLVEDNITENHSFIGVHFDFYNLFVAGQLDRFADSVYSAKVGLRF